jgi:small multidrug resistance pump
MAWLLLGLAIAAEVLGTLSLKASDGFSRLWPSVLVVAGYAAAFALLGVALRTLQVGVSYAIWSGLGTVGAAVGGLLIFGEKVPLLVMAGMAVVVIGVAMVTLGEAAH